VKRQDLLDYSSDLHQLASLVAVPDAPEQVMARALRALQSLVPSDLAAVLRLVEPTRLRVVAAAGPLASEAVRAHEVDLSHLPGIRQVLESRRPRAFEAHDHADQGDPYHDILHLE